MNKIPYAGKEAREPRSKEVETPKKRLYNKPIKEMLEFKVCLNCNARVQLSRHQRLCDSCRSKASNLSRYM